VAALHADLLDRVGHVLDRDPQEPLGDGGGTAAVADVVGQRGEPFGDDRGVSLPALTVTVEDMMAALRRVAGNRHLGEITLEPDPFIEAICQTWPQDTNFDRALDLGVPLDDGLDDIVTGYIEDYVEGD